jgi:putative ABC transport system permease protein
MNALRQDIVYGIRMLARHPVFTAVAALSLALGIGLNTAIFTLINTILWGSLSYHEPDRVMIAWSVPPNRPNATNGVSIPDFVAWKERSRSFESLGAMCDDRRDLGAEQNGVPAEQIQGEEFTPGLLQALGVQPLMGRLFTEAEDELDHAAPVIVITHRFWVRHFAADPDILKRTVTLDGTKTNIIGVMPPNFLFADDHSQYLAPLRLSRFQLRGSARYLLVAGRLKPGISLQQAQAEMDAVQGQFAKEFPADRESGKPWGVRLQTVREGLFGFMSRPLLLLQGAVGLVLLIACANVAALLLARASARHNEIAIRGALGAGRTRIIRQFLTESVVLSLAGGVLGVMMAWWGVQALIAMAPPFFPRLAEVSVDGRVLAFSAMVSILTGIVFGVAPALQGSRANFAEALREATRGGTAGGFRGRLRAGLVTAQLALALVLSIGSGLLIRSFLKMQHADLGCDPTGLMTFDLATAPNVYGHISGSYKGVPLWNVDARPAELFLQVLERVQSIPGVESATAAVRPPLTDMAQRQFSIEGRPVADQDRSSAYYYPITPEYFRTLKTPVLKGREFTMRDTANSPWVAIVNETMARRFWPDENPLGRHVSLDLSPDDQPREIIAVVHDVPAEPRQRTQEPAIYVPFFQDAPRTIGPVVGFRFHLTYLLRTQGQPAAVVPALRRAVADIDPNRPVNSVRTLEEILAEQVQYPRYYSMLVGLFAFVATALAAVGVYGVMAYAVEQRTREIGIRVALGASAWQVLHLVGKQALWIVLAGVALGLGGSMALTRYLSSDQWEVPSSDPVTFAAVAFILAAVAAAACLVPTRRAMAVDPTIALRYE